MLNRLSRRAMTEVNLLIFLSSLPCFHILDLLQVTLGYPVIIYIVSETFRKLYFSNAATLSISLQVVFTGVSESSYILLEATFLSQFVECTASSNF